MLSKVQRSAWIFWLTYAFIAAYCIVIFVPGIHIPPVIERLLLFALVGGILLQQKHYTVPQLVFSLVASIIATGFGVICMWNNWMAFVMVPAFLFSSICLYFVVRQHLHLRGGVNALLQ